MEILQHADLTPFNTFGIAAQAARLVHINTLDDVSAALDAARGQAPVILGGGSNVVFAAHIDALVMRINLLGKALLDESADHCLVECAAGENWHEMVRWTLAQGWPGLENLSLIPGTVGAAPIQNIGAYGVEFEQLFDSLTAIECATGRPVEFGHADCQFAYRDSLFKRAPGRYLITTVRLRLPKAWRAKLAYPDLARALPDGATPNALAISDAVMAVRRAKLPDWRRLGNAGSFFKNPIVSAAQFESLREQHPDIVGHAQADGCWKLAAGWLIERAGWKGRSIGPVGVYARQALVLVNHGGATGAQVLALAAQIAADVRDRFAVVLEREPVVMGQIS